MFPSSLAMKVPTQKRVRLELPSLARTAAFLDAVERSRALHRRWVSPPSTAEAYTAFVGRHDDDRSKSFLIVDERSDELVGVVNISEIVKGPLRSAYLGYYAFVPKEGKGFMRNGLAETISYSFRTMKLHRLEANIQPENTSSISLVRSLGFRMEGYSPRYLKIAGRCETTNDGQSCPKTGLAAKLARTATPG